MVRARAGTGTVDIIEGVGDEDQEDDGEETVKKKRTGEWVQSATKQTRRTKATHESLCPLNQLNSKLYFDFDASE